METIQKTSLHLRCTLLPGRFQNGSGVPKLYNTAYQHWKETWSEIFTDVGSPNSLNIENFLRQTILVCLELNGEFAGMATTTFFNSHALPTFDHDFFKVFTDEKLKEFKESPLILSSEYLSIPKKFRKANLGFSLREIIIGFVLKVFEESNGSYLLATTVENTKTHEVCIKFGYQNIGHCQKFNLNCLLMENTPSNLKSHPDSSLQEIINRCWNEKINYTSLLNPSQKTLHLPTQNPKIHSIAA